MVILCMVRVVCQSFECHIYTITPLQTPKLYVGPRDMDLSAKTNKIDQEQPLFLLSPSSEVRAKRK